jgi:hypothetical protein
MPMSTVRHFGPHSAHVHGDHVHGAHVHGAPSHHAPRIYNVYTMITVYDVR